MNELCAFAGCDKRVQALSLCYGHYQQNRRGRELKPLKVYKAKPNPTFCMWCNKQKTELDFYRQSNNKLQSECKSCMKKRK